MKDLRGRVAVIVGASSGFGPSRRPTSRRPTAADGIASVDPFAHQTSEAFDRLLAIDFHGVVCACRHFLPRGMLRNTHLRAFHDIRILSSGMMSDWRGREIDVNDVEAACGIIRDAEEERQRIAAYVRDAETALKSKQQG